MQANPVVSLSPSSPSFNTYSSDNLSEIASRVVHEEFRQKEFEFAVDNNREEDKEDEDEFEFAVDDSGWELGISSADEMFFNGQIKPLFDRSLLIDDDFTPRTLSKTSTGTPIIKSCFRPWWPLGKLMSEERETDHISVSCSSSSEELAGDDLDSLQPGTYCVWTPKASKESQSPGRRKCKKSNSTGSSKRWNGKDVKDSTRDNFLM